MRVYAQQSNQVVELTEQLGAGGEGTVFVWPLDPGFVCKVYHDSVLQDRGDFLARKLAAMLGVAPDDPMLRRGFPTFAWPEGLVFDPTNQQRLVGFVMPRINDSHSLHRLYSPGDRKQLALPPDQEGLTMEYYVMVATARNLAEAFRLLHARSYVMADVNEDNIRFRTDSTVSLIDNDSFQVRDRTTGEKFLVSVMKAEYWPVDSLELTVRGEALEISHDDFGLALFLFRLLMNGVHPYHGMGAPGVDPPTSVDNIAAGHFPFVPASSGGLRPPHHAPAFDSLTVELREMFERCFVEGARNPSARPDAATWVKALERAQETLKRCERGHLHFEEARLCPWCELEDALTSCPKGHTYYRAEGKCPRCALEQKRAAQRAPKVTLATIGISRPRPPRPAPQPVVAGSPTPMYPAPTGPTFFFPGSGTFLRNSIVLCGILLVALIVGMKFLRPHAAYEYPKPVFNTNTKDGAVEVLILAGPFKMGQASQINSSANRFGDTFSSDERDKSLERNNNPPHTVNLSAFWIYKNLVTVGQYKKYVAAMKASGHNVEMPPAPDFDQKWRLEENPIVNVSWNDAQGYCKWAGVKLPTEAQWEKAARGVDGRMFPWGNDFDAVKLWSSINGEKLETHKVGELAVSPYGVTDMAGNAWQWCQDAYDANFWKGSFQPLDPVNNSGEGTRVWRGGPYNETELDYFRSAYRVGNAPDFRNINLGFRCVAPASSSPSSIPEKGASGSGSKETKTN